MSRYQRSEKANDKTLQSAIDHSKRRKRRGKIASTDVDFDPAAKRRFDENYDAIFGKKELKHGRD